MRNFLIIGQGIAGTVLARQLEAANKSFHIIDGPQTPSASRVAAGVWNPIAVRRFLKAWLAEETVASARTFFAQEESHFNQAFFHETGLLKFMSNAEERKQMEERLESLKPFVKEDDTHEPAPGVNAPEGILNIQQAGYVNVSAYINACAQQWKASGLLIQAHFEHADLKRVEDGWEWKGELYEKVLFCEGISGLNNPWMMGLPLTNTKGQVMELSIPDLETTHILNKQIFVMPQKNHRFRIGSTYEWSFDDLNPTVDGKAKLLELLHKIIPEKKYEILSQDAGGRPTTRDRRPLLGELSEPDLYVFNGMGSRGVLLVPHLAECMIRYVQGDLDAIPHEARLQRFKKKKNLSYT